MLEQDGLGTLAEVFVGLAGFTGIALALKSSPKPYFLFRVVFIVSVSIVSIVISMMPTALVQADIAPDVVWRIGSGLMALTYVCALPFSVWFRQRAGEDELVVWLHTSLISFAVMHTLVQIANAVGLFGGYAFTTMYIGLLCVLIHCGALFLVLITYGRHEGDN